MVISLKSCAPYVNSYRCISYGDSAPRIVAWGIDNRTAGLRVPVAFEVSLALLEEETALPFNQAHTEY
ncbi:MAG: hypothetical protein IIB74_11905 [Proteobacteria bacterium]|nr:hypothetical protein [Pseudomonadota bacterium]